MESEKYFKNLSNKELDSLYAVLVRHPESVENMRQAKGIEKIMLDRYEIIATETTEVLQIHKAHIDLLIEKYDWFAKFMFYN